MDLKLSLEQRALVYSLHLCWDFSSAPCTRLAMYHRPDSCKLDAHHTAFSSFTGLTAMQGCEFFECSGRDSEACAGCKPRYSGLLDLPLDAFLTKNKHHLECAVISAVVQWSRHGMPDPTSDAPADGSELPPIQAPESEAGWVRIVHVFPCQSVHKKFSCTTLLVHVMHYVTTFTCFAAEDVA